MRRTRSLCSLSKLLQVIQQTLHIRQDVARLQLDTDVKYVTEALTHHRIWEFTKSDGVWGSLQQKGSWAYQLLSRDKCKNTEDHHKDKLFLKDGSGGYGCSAVHKYLGVQLAEEGTIDYKVKCCICKAEAAQNDIHSLHSATHVCPLALKVQLVKVQFSACFYGGVVRPQRRLFMHAHHTAKQGLDQQWRGASHGWV